MIRYLHTEAWKQQKSISMMGNTLAKGNKQSHNPKSSTTKEKMRQFQIKRFSSPEERQRASDKTKQQWAKPEHRAKMATAMAIVYADPLIRARQSEAMKRLWADPKENEKLCNLLGERWAKPEHRAKMAVAMSSVYNNPLVKKKQSAKSKERWANPEYRAKVTNSIKESHTKIEYREMASVKSKEIWANYTAEERTVKIQTLIQSLRQRPTKPERQLASLLDTFLPNEWEYIGDKKVVIGRKNPDFRKRDGSLQIIELFGDWWHSKYITGRTNKEEEDFRIKAFAEYGFDTLIIWEHELKQPYEVLIKIINFCSGCGKTTIRLTKGGSDGK